mmetsp:Transcript_22558/g.36716  ORF Transcript_22558/g.36716 Transcript_22558/m.36716 type:complete len:222 (-) Transcript_22558:1961-2626(-)
MRDIGRVARLAKRAGLDIGAVLGRDAKGGLDLVQRVFLDGGMIPIGKQDLPHGISQGEAIPIRHCFMEDFGEFRCAGRVPLQRFAGRAQLCGVQWFQREGARQDLVDGPHFGGLIIAVGHGDPDQKGTERQLRCRLWQGLFRLGAFGKEAFKHGSLRALRQLIKASFQLCSLLRKPKGWVDHKEARADHAMPLAGGRKPDFVAQGIRMVVLKCFQHVLMRS